MERARRDVCGTTSEEILRGLCGLRLCASEQVKHVSSFKLFAPTLALESCNPCPLTINTPDPLMNIPIEESPYIGARFVVRGLVVFVIRGNGLPFGGPQGRPKIHTIYPFTLPATS